MKTQTRAAAACHHAVTDLDQIVDLGAAADPGFTDGRTVDGAAAAHFNTVFEHNKTGLGHLAPAVGSRHKPEALGSNNSIGMHHTAVTDSAAGMENGVGMELAALTDLHIPVDHNTRMNHGPRTDSGVIADANPWADADTGSELHAVGDDRAGVDTGQRGRSGVKLFESFGEGQSRITTDRPSQLKALGELPEFLLIRN